MPDYEKLQAVLLTLLPETNIHANAIAKGVTLAPGPVAIYRQTSESRFSNFIGTGRSYTVFRVMFQAKTYTAAHDICRRFINAANMARPGIQAENVTSYYDEDRGSAGQQIFEVTARVF